MGSGDGVMHAYGTYGTRHPVLVELLKVRDRLVVENARGAMVIGSVLRGTALEASDLDVLVVAADDDPASF